NDTLASQSLAIAEETWDRVQGTEPLQRMKLAVELLITTKEQRYADFLVNHTNTIARHIKETGWLVGRTFSLIDNQQYKAAITEAVQERYVAIQQQGTQTPYGVPYEPNIWGAGWAIQ